MQGQRRKFRLLEEFVNTRKERGGALLGQTEGKREGARGKVEVNEKIKIHGKGKWKRTK